ncbi:MAG: sigma-54-dependent Fis family transcriptional regulator [Gammaproteobacteria bacterium]|nr:sigma-54-dependent Fis family transcriptional regulator [Gammaproteobacteria bacterium]
MTAKHVLIIDDEPVICELIEITLARMGLNSRSAMDLADAKKLVDSEHFDLCLTDMRLPDGDGIEMVSYVQQHHPEIPIAVITAHGNMELAVRALKAGAFDFVSKPVDIQILRNLVSSAITLPDEDSSTVKAGRTTITGVSPAVAVLTKKIAKLARSQAPVFIHGESGSGKERVARMIHEQGSRCHAPFIPVNCGAIPAELMESEFFGHLKGSFTGASADKEGLFQAANGGTLFLDEIAELPLHMQVKLLRVIQEKAVKPVGAHREIPVDVRILSASHKNLAVLIKEGLFREDLYYRINVIELTVPSLRQRCDDIPLLAKQILEQLAYKTERSTTPQLDNSAIRALQQYSFPGNVRELENILERALALADGDVLYSSDFNFSTIKQTQVTSIPVSEVSAKPLDLVSQEKNSIMHALEQTRWNKTAAAKLLGLSLRQLRYRLDKYQID